MCTTPLAALGSGAKPSSPACQTLACPCLHPVPAAPPLSVLVNCKALPLQPQLCSDFCLHAVLFLWQAPQLFYLARECLPAGLLVPMQHRNRCRRVIVHTLAVTAEKVNAFAWQSVAAELALSWQVGIHPPVGAVSTQGGLARQARARC